MERRVLHAKQHAPCAHCLLCASSARYETAMLIEINAHSLFSKYFSESGEPAAVYAVLLHGMSLCIAI